MPNELPQTAKSIIVLLNNALDLIVLSNKRREAADVMKAITIYADGKGFSLPKEKFENFHAILLDSRPNTLAYLIRDICRSIAEERS
jgi:hypothetical protein